MREKKRRGGSAPLGIINNKIRENTQIKKNRKKTDDNTGRIRHPQKNNTFFNLLLWVDLIVSDFLSHLSVSIPLAGLLIRIHFLWIRIQLFFSIRIRIHSPASVSLPFCLILQTLSLRVSDILSYISVSIPPCL